MYSILINSSIPSGSANEVSICHCKRFKRCRFNPWVGKIPWKSKWQPTPVSLPGESYEQWSLVGHSPRGRKESDTTERLHFPLSFSPTSLPFPLRSFFQRFFQSGSAVGKSAPFSHLSLGLCSTSAGCGTARVVRCSLPGSLKASSALSLLTWGRSLLAPGAALLCLACCAVGAAVRL